MGWMREGKLEGSEAMKWAPSPDLISRGFGSIYLNIFKIAISKRTKNGKG